MTMAVCKWQRRRQRQSRLHTILATVERFSPSRNFQFSSVYSNGSILSAFNAVEFFSANLNINCWKSIFMYNSFFTTSFFIHATILSIVCLRYCQLDWFKCLILVAFVQLLVNEESCDEQQLFYLWKFIWRKHTWLSQHIFDANRKLRMTTTVRRGQRQRQWINWK